MISLSSGDLSNGLHLALGALFVTFPVCWGWDHAQLWGSGIGIVFGLVKEFWWDLRYETPETSGGVMGGVTDFLGYLGGIFFANLFLLF